jgi:hypothetical protein
MPYRQARVGENEALFREVNETVAAAAGSMTGPIEFLCECGKWSCAEGISLTREEYEHVRAVPDRFFVKPDHNRAEIENVVERHGTYWIVQKFGEASDVARQTDPRSGNGDRAD